MGKRKVLNCLIWFSLFHVHFNYVLQIIISTPANTFVSNIYISRIHSCASYCLRNHHFFFQSLLYVVSCKMFWWKYLRTSWYPDFGHTFNLLMFILNLLLWHQTQTYDIDRHTGYLYLFSRFVISFAVDSEQRIPIPYS